MVLKKKKTHILVIVRKWVSGNFLLTTFSQFPTHPRD